MMQAPSSWKQEIMVESLSGMHDHEQVVVIKPNANNMRLIAVHRISNGQ
jgi:hypothetical protein